MYRDRTIAAVVPAYNEEGFVGDVIDGIPSFVDRAYVVDDGSTDDTWAEIRRHAIARNEVHDGRFEELIEPIQHEDNRGVGGAIKTGYLRARAEEMDVTVVLGGDDQMDPEQLTRYIDPIVDGVADYTKGNRFARPEDRAEMPKFRLVGNVILSVLTKIASGYWDSMDSQNGYTAISLSALRRTDIEGMYEYYGYCNDLLVRLNVADVRIADVPRSSEYAYSEGWKSHIDYKEYIPRVSNMLFRSFQWRLREKYLLEQYNPLAALYLFGVGVIGAGATGLLAALSRREGTSGSWFLSIVLGGLTVLYASILDRADNEHLESHLEPEALEESAGGQATAETGSAESGSETPEQSSPLPETSGPLLVGTGGDVDSGSGEAGTDGTDPDAGGTADSDTSDGDATDGDTIDEDATDSDTTPNGDTNE